MTHLIKLSEHSPETWASGDGFVSRLVHIAGNRRSPEAVALYELLMGYVSKRVQRIGGRLRLACCDQDELLSEVLLSLMRGGLLAFRGGSLPELLGYVRTITDRTAWKLVRRRDRMQLMVDPLMELPPVFPQEVEIDVDSPLSEGDQDYLIGLLEAGTKAEYARSLGVSRAAITQKVQRIRSRVAKLGEQDRGSHEAWLWAKARVIAA